jgi:hypothetical protein
MEFVATWIIIGVTLMVTLKVILVTLNKFEGNLKKTLNDHLGF